MGSVVLEGRQQVPFQGGKVAYALSHQPIQAEGRLREVGRQKRRNFFLISAPC